MPLRLIVRDEDRIQVFDLEEGDQIAGSGVECEVRLRHPTISRRHARFSISGSGAEIEDLGSRNGTRVAGRKVDGREPLAVGQEVRLGSLAMRLEQVASEDLEVAVPLLAGSTERGAGLGDRPGRGLATLEPVVTASLGALHAFVLRHLPQIVRRVEAGETVERLAQVLGVALFETLPSARVEVTRGGPSEGVLFRAEKELVSPGGESTVEVRTGRLIIEVSFGSEVEARTYRPVVEAAAAITELGPREVAPRPRPADPVAVPPLPEPATIDPEVRRVYTDAARVAQGEIGVLISGESGTGKEVLARYLHAASRRAAGPFVALNCAALPRDLLEAELFGVERGAATGVESRPGKFEVAHAGTLFLDEIGDMAAETQSKILRVLQEGEVHRVGGTAARSARPRIIAATNRNVERLMAEREFRADLYHRIADWAVELPALRERRGDIANLAAFFLHQESVDRGVRIAGISRGALDLLEAFPWPGNIRQLQREMARCALFLEDGGLLESSHLQPAIRIPSRGTPKTLREKLEAFERDEIEQALRHHDGQVAAVASVLGVGRATLYRRIKELGIERASDGE